VLISKFEEFALDVRLDEWIPEESVVGGFKAILTD
jgi:hypothetical protein